MTPDDLIIKLSYFGVKDGDLFLLTLHEDATAEQAERVNRSLTDFANHAKIKFLIGDIRTGLTRISEKEMNKIGWYKK